ncbi:hypothetical protein SAMN05216420_10914 [Nitrosospira sp. Nl5]|nr:hypothetical protein SAMN05216420_10914 [Nitrosospira sp. Nl5]
MMDNETNNPYRPRYSGQAISAYQAVKKLASDIPMSKKREGIWQKHLLIQRMVARC